MLAVALAGVAGATLLILRPQPQAGCQPFLPTPNRTKPLDLAYLKAQSRHTEGNLDLSSPAVTRHFLSQDRRNFAVEVSVSEYSVAFGLPETDMQNPFYRMDPARRMILVVSYGHFVYVFAGDFAAQRAPDPADYSVGAVALDAREGSVLTGIDAVCK